MPNSYSVVPNVLPGNVTVGGDLTVTGSVIRLGSGPPFARLARAGGGNLLLTNNLASDLVTRDDAAQAANVLDMFQSTAPVLVRRMNAAGNFNDVAPQAAIFTDYTRHTHTGTVTADTIYSKLIRANNIGPNGGLHLHFLVSPTLQGAGNTIVNLLWGGTTTLIFSIAAANTWAVDVYINNRNAANAQVLHWEVRNLTSGVVSGSTITAAQDTTADITVGVQVQNANVGDSQNFEMVVGKLINSFGPV